MLAFIYELRRAEIPVSVQYILEFYHALRRGLAPDLDRLFLLSRLIFIKRVEHYDTFERIFSSFFLGKNSPAFPGDWEEALAGKPFQEWLKEQIEKGAISPDQLHDLTTEELLARFWETLLAQQGEHHGGNRWIGTRGRSPFGHGGKSKGGMRVHGNSLHGTAQKVIGRRNYINYSDNSTLAQENLRQVLASLKNYQLAGPETELDIDQTISRTARNGGEIELVFTREMRDRLKVILLLDNGGYSMWSYVNLVKEIFGKIRQQFKELKHYYFHNCIYGTVYQDKYRTMPVPWETLLARGADTHLIIIGDANMAPAELMAANGSLYMQPVNDRKPGREWLQDLRAAFPASVWLNPISKDRWMRESVTINHIARIFRMEDLTLAGIKNAVEYLNLFQKRQ